MISGRASGSNKSVCPGKKSCSLFHFYYQNVRGLRTKTKQVYNAVNSSDYDIIIFTETWLISSISDIEIFNDSYTIYRKDRHLTSVEYGGGVLIAIQNKFKSEQIELKLYNSNSFDFDMVAIQIKFKDRSAFVLNAYIPQINSSNKDNIILTFKDFLANIQFGANDFLFIFGDFNLPHIIWKQDCNNTETFFASNVTKSFDTELFDLFSSYGLLQCNNILNKNGKLLDLIWFSYIDEDLEIFECPLPLSKIDSLHHPPIEGLLRFNIPDLEYKPTTDPSLDFFKANYKSLSEYLKIINWNLFVESLNSLNVNQSFDLFYNTIYASYAEHVPLIKTTSSTSKNPLWNNKSLRKLKNQKSAAHKKFRKTSFQNDYIAYSILRKKYSILHDYLYNMYLCDIETNLKTDPKSFWKYLKSKRANSGLPSSMTFRDQTAKTIEEISSLFADHFESAYLNIDEYNIPSPNEYNIPAYNLLNRLKTITFTTQDIINACKYIKWNCFEGPDKVPASVILSCIHTLALPLTELFNKSLAEGQYPDILKCALVIPVHKSGPKSKVENYRGVTNLCPIAKIFDALINEQLFEFVSPLIETSQHGFIRNKSTVSNLVEFTNTAINAMESGAQLDVVYIDFEKAFDRVQPIILLRKLETMGIEAKLLNWFESYLKSRTQKVRVNNQLSRLVNVYSGVGQGSHSGPTLFNICINDLPKFIVHTSKLLFADDLKLFTEIKTTIDGDRLQKDLNSLELWCSSNCFNVNAKKCSTMSFARIKNPLAIKYKLNNICINRLTIVKDLGVTFDIGLSFNDHINAITKKAFNILGFLKRFCNNFNDPYTLKTLYCSLIRSRLEYCSVVWNPAYEIASSRIESIQKQFLLYALRNLKWDPGYSIPSYENRLMLLDMQSLKKRRDISDLIFVHDILSEKVNSVEIKN